MSIVNIYKDRYFEYLNKNLPNDSKHLFYVKIPSNTIENLDEVLYDIKIEFSVEGDIIGGKFNIQWV